MNFPQIGFSLAGRELRLRLQLSQGFATCEPILWRAGNRLEQNRATSVVNGDLLAFDGGMHQFAQVPAGFLHGQSFHAKILLAIRLKGKRRR